MKEKAISGTYIKRIDSVLDWEASGSEVSILAHSIHNACHGGVGSRVVILGNCGTHLHLVIHFVLRISCFLFID